MQVWARKSLWAMLAAVGAIAALHGCTDSTTAAEPDTAVGVDSAGPDGATTDAAGGDSQGSDAATGDTAGADALDADSAGTDAAGQDGTATDGSDADAEDTGKGDADAALVDADAEGDTQIADTASDAKEDAGPDTTTPFEKGIYPATCTADADCKNACTAGGSCKEGKCTFVPKAGACLVDTGDGKVECIGEGDTSEQKPCLVCAKAAKGVQLSSNSWVAPLDKAGEGVVIAEVFKTGISWNYSTKRSISGGSALYFGDPTKSTYNNNKQVGALATLPPAKVPAAEGLTPSVVFWLWLDTEQSPGDDLLSVSVIDGTTPIKLWNSDAIGGSTHGNWQRIAVPLKDLAGKTVQVVLGFETKDGTLNAFEGAYVDDLAISTGCCASEADCNDGNPCTADGCAAQAGKLPQCSHSAKADCCASSADCDDDKPCTLDLCSAPGGTCSHSDLPGCCMSVGDCDDKDSCTEDACPAPGGACTHANQCCKSDSECASADPCKKGSCIGGQCSFADTCCTLDGDCDDLNPCTIDACDKGKCTYASATVPGCCAPVLVNAKFDSDEGWASKSTNAALGWVWADAASASKNSPNGVLKMGSPTGAPLSVANNSQWVVTGSSPMVSVLSGKETLFTFSAFVPSGTSTSTVMRVFATIDGVDVNFLTVYGYSLTGSWKSYSFDLTPLGGKSFPIQFEVKPSSTVGSLTGTGIYLDDIAITSTCKAKACTSSANCQGSPWPYSCLAGTCTDGQCTYSNSCCQTSADCNDGNLCTTDTCGTSKKCSFAAIKSCCMGNGDCNDANACTQDVCPAPGGTCQNPAIGGCCLSSAACDDKNSCTSDVCSQNKCINTNTCCTSDAGCNDNDSKCTTDKCVGGKCIFSPTGAAGCCKPDVWVNDFDQGDLKDITINNSQGPGKGWHISSSPPGNTTKTPPGVLWYGDPATSSFSFGGVANNGKATTPKILLPSATPSSLSMWLFMDTEGGTTYDKLTISLIVDGAKSAIFTKAVSSFSTNSWYEVKADLSLHSGKEIQVEFDFNTTDSAVNDGKGVFIDDLKILTKCGG
jgi:hypothetical protein